MKKNRKQRREHLQLKHESKLLPIAKYIVSAGGIQSGRAISGKAKQFNTADLINTGYKIFMEEFDKIELTPEQSAAFGKTIPQQPK